MKNKNMETADYYLSVAVGLALGLVHEVDMNHFDGAILDTLNIHEFIHGSLGVSGLVTTVLLVLVGFGVTYGVQYYREEVA